MATSAVVGPDWSGAGGLGALEMAACGKPAEGNPQASSKRAAVPVVAGQAEGRDFPIYLNGLGTVQAYYGVTIRARVDGELQQVYFQEGQNVQKGDLLAQIDPRPYQAQLDQAKAKKAQDEAQLASARLMLQRNALLIKNSVVDQQTYDTQKYAVDQIAGAGCGGPGRHRECADPARLYPHHGADLRPGWHSARWMRETSCGAPIRRGC